MKHLTAYLLCVLLSAGFSAAQAETLSGSGFVGGGEGPFELKIPKFDPGLGTLTDATAFVSWSTFNYVSVWNGLPSSTIIEGHMNLGITGPGGEPLGGGSLNIYSDVIPPNSTKNVSMNATGSFSVPLARLGLSALTQEAPEEFTLLKIAETNGSLSVPYPYATFLITSFTARLDYTYIFSPVPEPANYSLMLAGLGLISFVAKRRSWA